MNIDFVYVLTASFGAIGVIEYLKGFFEKAPSLVWRLLLPLACLGVAYFGPGDLSQRILHGILMLAASQIGYSQIIKKFQKQME